MSKPKRKKKTVINGFIRQEAHHTNFVGKKKTAEFNMHLFIDDASGRYLRSDFKKAKVIIEE